MMEPLKKPFFMHLFAGALVLTSVLSVLLAWHILDSYNDSRQIQSKDIKLLDLSWTVFHRDETLSTSVRMAATSGEPKWEQQYRDFVPQIEAALKEMGTLELESHECEAIGGLEKAHKELQSIENRAFEHLHQGREDSAVELLSMEAYEELQHTFLTNINRVMGSARSRMDAMLNHQRRQARNVAISIAFTLPVLLISWFFVLSTIRRYLVERNRAEASLRMSEEKYRELVESANSIILRMDAEGKITFINEFAQRFFGYSPDEIYGRNIIGTLIPQTDSSGKDLSSLVGDILKDPDHFQVHENENMRKDGERVWVTWTNRSILDDQGRLVGILSIGNDITARKRAEEALREQYRFLQHLIDTIPSPIFYKDKDGLYQGCNKAFEAFIGYSKEGIAGKSVFEVAPEDLARKYHKMDSLLFENPGIQVYEASVRYADGARHDVIFTKATYLNPDTTVAGLVGVMVDITDRKRMEEALRIDEARLEGLYELSQMTDSSTKEIIRFALDRQIELTSSEIGFLGFMNEDGTVLDLHAWSETVLKECRVEDQVVHFPIEGAGLWAEAIRSGQPMIVNDYQAASQHSKKGYPQGHLTLTRFLAVPIVEGGRIVAMVAVANKQTEYDASDVRQLTLFLDGVLKLVQRRRAEQALIETERLAAMGRAMSSVAHDIKTPLIAIGGFSLMVRNHMEMDNPDWKKLDIVVKETRRLEHMVKDMLDFSKPLDLQRSTEDIQRLLAESLMIVEDVAKESGVEIKMRLPEAPLQVEVDAVRMKQVMVNLIMNAAQASPQGESVIVQSHNEGYNLVIEVVDHGHGIPKEKREEIFSPFFTTKREGTGLGLAIVRKIVDAHEGHITILDNPGGGVTFRIAVPMAPKKQDNNRSERLST
jgi:PAS domain S-box-containing protein